MAGKVPWKPDEAAGDNFRGNIAANYLADRINKPAWKLEYEAVSTYLDLVDKGAAVLDVPFGTGRFVPLYLKHQMKVTGIDISSDMLAIAKSELGDIYNSMDIRLGNADSLPFPDSYFDVIVSIRFLESIIPMSKVKPCLREMRRVCKGHAIVRLNNRLENFPPVAPPVGNERMGSRYYLTQVEELLHSTGWKLVQSTVFLTDPDKKGEKRVCFLSII